MYKSYIIKDEMKISHAIIKSTISLIGKKMHENLNEKRIESATLGLDIEDAIYVNSEDIPDERSDIKEFLSETFTNISSCFKCGDSVRAGNTFCFKCIVSRNKIINTRRLNYAKRKARRISKG